MGGTASKDFESCCDSHSKVLSFLRNDWNHNVDELSKLAKRVGKICFTYPNGDIYEGEVKDSVKNGYGMLIYSNGDVYTGNFVDDLKQGRGILKLANGDVFYCCFEKDRMNGKGVCRFASGAVFDGIFTQDKMCGGSCKYIFANGDSYEGEWSKMTLNGRGILKYKNGDIYVGEFLDGKRHGLGIFHSKEVITVPGTGTLISWNRYEGEFVNGTKSGHGEQRCADGNILKGTWLNDELCSSTEQLTAADLDSNVNSPSRKASTVERRTTVMGQRFAMVCSRTL